MKFKKVVLTVLFYGAYICCCNIGEYFVPSGVCNPGLGFLMFMGLVPVSLILFARSAIMYYKNPEKERVYCMGIHVLVFLGFMIFIKMA